MHGVCAPASPSQKPSKSALCVTAILHFGDRSGATAQIGRLVNELWSGQTEGQITKLKLLNRQMDGRADLDLPRCQGPRGMKSTMMLDQKVQTSLSVRRLRGLPAVRPKRQTFSGRPRPTRYRRLAGLECESHCHGSRMAPPGTDYPSPAIPASPRFPSRASDGQKIPDKDAST